MRVYHLKYQRDADGPVNIRDQEPEWPKHYEHVAIASAAGTLDEAFRLTNSINQPWWRSVFVQPTDDKKKYRSTSIWDVIVDTKTNTVYRVENIGFKEIAKWNSNEKEANVH